jgi:hypothetical protein
MVDREGVSELYLNVIDADLMRKLHELQSRWGFLHKNR